MVAFVSSSDNGGAGLLAEVAMAIAAQDRRVIVLQTDTDAELEEEFTMDGGLLPADYVLVGLPFRSTPFARSVLDRCDLVIVASSCKIEFLPEAEDIVRVLCYLGIETERIAGVLVDPEGILSSEAMADIKPYVESSLGIEMAGVVSFGSDGGSQRDRDIGRLVQYIK
jgi:hypothetical protein